ncbi:MAG TPA: hypothetical protein PLI43_08355 [Albidovulum sp.]|uniref:hypothetical protein n=1 Tax=Albidovulum sp. TaxID=1872424 RepID=UPI002C59EA4E|nr:hypothetical protein [Albidovulum sp.]
MKWLLVAIVYTVTGESVPSEVRVHETPFSSEALCEAARAKMEDQLRTRAITVKATCVQVSE